MRARAYLSTLPHVLRQQDIEQTYEVYVTESLRCIGISLRGQYLEQHFMDIIHPKPEETRTPEEIIADIRTKLKEVR